MVASQSLKFVSYSGLGLPPCVDGLNKCVRSELVKFQLELKPSLQNSNEFKNWKPWFARKTGISKS